MKELTTQEIVKRDKSLKEAGTSDIYTVAIRTVSGATSGDAVGSISFYDLTQ